MPAWEIVVSKGPKQGSIVPLVPERPVTIGRAPANDLCLADPAVSSYHARIELKDGTIVLTDLKSKNGSFVNGKQLQGAMNLKSTDQVEMGSSSWNVRPLPETVPSPAPNPPPAMAPMPRRIDTPSGSMRTEAGGP